MALIFLLCIRICLLAHKSDEFDQQVCTDLASEFSSEVSGTMTENNHSIIIMPPKIPYLF